MRRFEYADEKSDKFWEAEQCGTELTIRWGRSGTAGQRQTKQFADDAKAGAAMLKLIAEKTAKGYLEKSDTAAQIVPAPVRTAPAATPAPAAQTRIDGERASASASPSAFAPACSPALCPDSMDQEIERAFLGIAAQMADGTLKPRATGITAARIRRMQRVSEMVAGEVSKQLLRAGLLSDWQSTITDDAPGIAAGILARHAASPQDGQAATGPAGPASVANDGAPAAPWLACGTPLRIGDAADSTHRLARASRRHPQPVAPIEPQPAWEELRMLIPTGIAPDFLGSDPRLRDDFKAAWDSLNQAQAGGTLRSDAILMSISLTVWIYNRAPADAKFVDYLVARHGVAYAVEVLIESLSFDAIERHAGERHVRMACFSPSSEDFYRYTEVKEGYWRLRSHLAAAPQTVHDACAERVRAVMDGLGPFRRVMLALLFPHFPEMSHALIAQLCADSAPPPSVQWLQINATDPGALAKARKITSDRHLRFWDSAEMVSTVLLEHGTDAVRWLAPGAGYDLPGDALTRIGTPEALESLARAAGSSKPALARFLVAVRRWPSAAMVALGRVLAGQGKDHSMLTPTLTDLVRQHPALPEQLRPWLEPAVNAVLDSLRARLAGPGSVAADDELPEVLARAPWLKAKTRAVKALLLDALPLPSVEQWDVAHKASILRLEYFEKKSVEQFQASPDAMALGLGFFTREATPEHAAMRDALAHGKLPEMLAAWRSMHASRKENGYYFSLDAQLIAHMPAAQGIAFWNSIAGETRIRNVEYLAAAWGLPAFPGLLARVASAPAEHLGIALHFGVVELGPIAARAFARMKALRGTGREWLKRFPEHAACALIAPALGKPGEERDCAAAALRYLVRIGHAALLDQVAARYARPDVLPALHGMLNENPLDRYPSKRPALPEFWKPDHWRRPLLHNGKALPDGAIDALGTMMAFPTNEEVYAGLAQVKQACSAGSLADFSWDCFSAWLNASAPSRESWAMQCLGLFGNDDSARKLTAYLRAWPGEAAHARAVAGLDVLAMIGSDVALMLLNGIAQKVKFKGLQDKAIEKIASIAEARGLSQEELEDRLAPDLGLDEHGSLVLDFGSRAFRVAFDEALKPHVREWQDGKAGARLPDLPKPKQTDDETLATQATERFKRLKKDARTIASQQVQRLEVAMCVRRRWSADVFARCIAGHPLLRHLARRLVWGVYAMPVDLICDDEERQQRVASYGGELHGCFRVSDDGQYTTAADDAFSLPEGEHYRIGLPHALELPAAQAAEFGQLLLDYELLQPFVQLGRDTYALTEQERAQDRFERWNGARVATAKVLGLASNGWRRGAAADGGCIWTYDKAVDGSRGLELMLDPGILVGMVNEFPEQTLGDILIVGATRAGASGSMDTLATLDPIVASELIRDMERLRA